MFSSSSVLDQNVLITSTHQHISVFKIVSPVRPDLPLASNVPDIQFKTLRLDTLNVESLERTQKWIRQRKQMLFLVPNIHTSAKETPPPAPITGRKLHCAKDLSSLDSYPSCSTLNSFCVVTRVQTYNQSHKVLASDTLMVLFLKISSL